MAGWVAVWVTGWVAVWVTGWVTGWVAGWVTGSVGYKALHIVSSNGFINIFFLQWFICQSIALLENTFFEPGILLGNLGCLKHIVKILQHSRCQKIS